MRAFAPRAEPGLATLGSLASLGGIWNGEAVPASRTTLFAVVAAVVLLAVVAAGLPVVIRTPDRRPAARARRGGRRDTDADGDGPGLAAVESMVRAMPGLGRAPRRAEVGGVGGARIRARRGGRGADAAAVGARFRRGGRVQPRPDRDAARSGVGCRRQGRRGAVPAGLGGGRGGDQRRPASGRGVARRTACGQFAWAGDAPVLDPLPRWVRADVLTTGDLTISGRAGARRGRPRPRRRTAAGDGRRSRCTRPCGRGLAGRRVRRRADGHPDRRRPPRRVAPRVRCWSLTRYGWRCWWRAAPGALVGRVPRATGVAHYASDPFHTVEAWFVMTAIPSVFDADLPTVEYEDSDDSRRGTQEPAQGPRAGPDRDGGARPRDSELRVGARDAARPPVPGAARPRPRAQGITSGPLWDRASTSPAGHERRRPHPVAPARVQGVHPAVGQAARRHHRRRHHRVDRRACRGWALRGRRRHRAALPGADHLRAARCAPRGLAAVLRLGRRFLQAVHLERRRVRERHPHGVGRTRRLHRRHGRHQARIAHRRPDLGD